VKRSLVFLLILSLMLTATPGFGQTITHENEARTLYELNLFKGISTTEFVPDLANMSNREQAMTIIAVALQWQLDMSAKSPFKDVSDWAQPYVAKAYQMGITSGISATEFGGKRNVTQRELAAWMLRALGYDGLEAWENTVQLSGHVGANLDSNTMNTQINRDMLVGMLYNFLKEGKVISESKTLIQKYLDTNPNYAGIAQKAGMTAPSGDIMEFVLIENTAQKWDAASAMMKTTYSYDTGLIDSNGKFMLLNTAGAYGIISRPAIESTTFFIKDISVVVPFSNGRAVGVVQTISLTNVIRSYIVVHTNIFLKVTGSSFVNSDGAPVYSINTVSIVQSEGSLPQEIKPAGLFRVGLIVDPAGIGENAINRMAWEGIKKFAHIYLLSSSDYSYQKANSYEDLFYPFELMGIHDKNLIIANGFGFNEAVAKYADLHPSKNFVIIDGFVDRPNVTSIGFKEEEGSFLAGVAAGLKALEAGATKVGFIGGMDFDLIQKFEAGYEAGVKAAAPSVQVVVDYIGTFTEESIAKSAAASMYDDGAFVIFHAAGPAGMGIIDEAKERASSGDAALVIGVDYDQYDDGIYASGKSVVLTSMIKRFDSAVFNVCASAYDKKLTSGLLSFGLDEESIGLPSVNPNLSQDINQKIYDFEEKIILDELTVPIVPLRLK